MDFEQLRIFLVLAEERTFLGTANRLATSRSRVRRKLDQLELDAGTPLVSREQSGLVLTAAGEALVRRGQALLEEAEHLISHVHDVGSEPTGCLKIAMPVAPPPVGWSETCRRAQLRFPKLRIEFLFAESPTELLPSRAEIALTFEDRRPDACSFFDMGEFPMQLVVSDGYLEAHGVPRSIDALSDHRVAVWRVPDRPPERLPLRSGRLFEFEPNLISVEPAELHRMVVASECIGYLPALPQLADPALKVLFAEEVAGTVHTTLVVPDVLAEVPRVMRFVEMSQLLVADSPN